MIKNPRTFVTMLAVISVCAIKDGKVMRYLFSLLFATAALMLTAFVSTSHALPLNPIPSPSAAGWNQEGSEGFTKGTPLVVNDADAVPNPAFPLPFCNLFALGTDADFSSEIVVKPNVSVDAGFVTDGDGSTGVHVTINDGLREIKAALLQGAAGGLRLAIRTQVGFSPGIELGALSATFTVRRTTAGDAIIEAAGKTETVQAIDLPGSTRAGTKTLEFGTYDTSSASVSRWMTLGLESVTVPVAIDIKPGSFPNSINLNSSGVIPVAILSTPTFDAPARVDPATVRLAGASVNMVGKSDRYLCHAEDVNADGLPDLVCQVVTAQFMIELGDSEAMLEAQTFDGIRLQGRDSVRIVPN